VDDHDAFSVRIPRLATQRLLLREPRMADFDGFAENAADPLARLNIGGPLDRRNASRHFHAVAGHWVIDGIGWWVVEEAEAGPVGLVGVFRRETGPELEIGWSIHRPYWGRGYAPEAARAALHFGLETQPDRRVIAYVGTKNAQSCAVATKIGMTLDGESDFYGEKHLLYARTR
jgi:RimJ/RimL family protein N-acetyltransferase